jgi:tetratricopeptide (TPR) repeat protein
MKFSIYVLLLGLQISVAEAAPESKTWTEWVTEGKTLANAGNFRAAADAFRAALAIGDSANIAERALAEIISSLAAAYSEEGLYADSEREWRRALTIVKRIEGEDSLDYALLLGNVSILPTGTGDHQEEIATFSKALSINQGSDSPRDLAMVRGCLANLLIKQLRYSEAETFLNDSQPDFSRLAATDPQLVAQLLDYLGMIRFGQGRFAESVEFHQRSASLLESRLGPDHPALVVSLNNLAVASAKLGHWQKAAAVYRRATAICSNTLGADHPNCGVLLDNYAVVLRAQGHKREAEKMAARSRAVLAVAERRNGLGMVVNVTALPLR